MQKITSKQRWGLWVVGIACLLLISPIRVTPISLLTGKLQPAFSADMIGAAPVVADKTLDLNQDGKQECVSLEKGVLTVYGCGSSHKGVLWQSPAEWTVKQWIISDLNGDAASEITMLVWRDFSPWPVDKVMPAGGRIESFHDAQGKSCHVVMLGWEKGAFQEIWAGSALHDPVISLLAADVDDDGMQELVTIEGNYGQAEPFRSGPVAIWKWSGFGFSLQQRLEGSFRHMVFLENAQKWLFASQ